MIGASTVVCSFSVTASSTRTCTATGLTNGTPYYFKIFVQDTSGNWSTGVALDPVSPGNKVVTLGSGNDPAGGNLPPGSSATTSNTFTLTTDTGTDVIQSVTVTTATTTAQALSLIEITNDAGSTIYGSVANPTSDIIPITLSTNTLTANTSTTTYRIRVTPKTHANMPAVPGSTYYLTSYISGLTGTSGTLSGSDQGATTTVLTIDNESPSAPSALSGTKTRQEQLILSYTTASTADAQDIIIIRSTSPITDSPVEGTNNAVGNIIGASTVTCVASSTPLSSVNMCTFTSPLRATNYYFKAFTKDTTGNYSLGTSFTGQPFRFALPNSGRIYSSEVESQNGATTTVSGGGSGGGYGGVGTTTSATTTVSTTTPSKGGGGGDSGFIYHGSNIASLFNKALNFFISSTLTGVVPSAYADEPVPTIQVSTCALKVFGVCVVSNFPGVR
jgi:hypothetical protein